MESNKKNSRVMWIDILRGFMMFTVVVGHALYENQHIGSLRKYIFSFHMPAFFLISGMTFFFNKETDAKKYLVKKIKGLLVPYALLNIYVVPLYYYNVTLGMNKDMSLIDLFKGLLFSNTVSGYNMPSNTTWFITCLFIVDIVFFAYRQLFKSDLFLITAVVTVTGVFYTLDYSDGIGGGRIGAGIWHWQTAFTGVVFYMAGYFFMKNIGSITNFLTENKARGVLLSLIFLVSGYMIAMKNSRVSLVNDRYGDHLYFYLSAFLTTFAVTFVIIMLSEYKVFLKLAVPIKFIGINTLPYIAIHEAVMKTIRAYIPILQGKNNSYRLVMGVVVYFALMPVAWAVSKLLPFRKKKPKKTPESTAA